MKFRLFGVPRSDAPGGVMRSVVAKYHVNVGHGKLRIAYYAPLTMDCPASAG